VARRDRTTAAAAIVEGRGGAARDEHADDSAFLVVSWGNGPESRGLVVPLVAGREVTIGRQAENTVSIEHAQVSRRHAAVIRHGSEITVRDLDSRNGTRVNGSPIEGPTRVSAGDEITLGPVTAVVGVSSGLRARLSVGSLLDLEERLESELDRSARYRRPVGLVMLHIDGPADAADAVVDALAQRMRRMDFVAQYGAAEYAVLLPEADRAATEATAHRLAAELRATGHAEGIGTVYAGLAVCPHDATRAGALMSRARTALRRARAGAGERGISRAPTESGPESAAVVVVDPLMKRVMEMARKVAETPITVLVLGETGCGKEIVAGEIHRQSPRAERPFLALNCSALSETLLESELFGHERGAFTGADRRKIGYFEAASGGTIFLDEVGELPQGVQAKLLRVLEQRTITRVGGTQPVTIDARVVCATNRDLEAEVERGRFREDLYFRIGAFTLVVPPLRDRRSEILPLAEHFARQFSGELGADAPGFTAAARAALERHDWPGNVRELRNAIERAVVLAPTRSPEPLIDVEHLPERLGGGTPEAVADGGIRGRVARLEKTEVAAALGAEDGNQTRAAARLGISRFALIRLMQKYGLRKKRGS